jgi:tetratricopeptide (TPR) repeat protein/transcriptional regulator with XRE-family HTH domain
MASHALEPVRVSAEFWQRDDVQAALDTRDIGALLRLVRQHTGASQDRIGTAVGMSQPEISKIMRVTPGHRRVTALDLLARIANGLDVPDHGRKRLGLAHGATAATPPSPFSATVSTDGTDWPMWFGMRLANAVSMVHTWTGEHTDTLQTLLHQEILMFDASAPSDRLPVFETSRRQALITIATLPIAIGGLRNFLETNAAVEFFLSRCAASLAACWHLLKGSDLDTVDRLLNGYLTQLEMAARTPSKQQSAAARLASQGHRISGIIALHRNHIRAREHHCKQAVEYAAMAADVPTQVSALISLASTYFYQSDPVGAAATYEHALVFDADMSPLQRSRARAELSVVYGQLGRQRETLESVEVAEKLYPQMPEHDPSYLYAEFTRASLTLEQGLAYLALAQRHPDRGYQQTASDVFARIEHSRQATVPDRIRYEIINHQASTAVLLGDLDAFEDYIIRGVQGASILDSTQRRKEALAAWHLANQMWPTEPRLKAIGRELIPALTAN